MITNLLEKFAKYISENVFHITNEKLFGSVSFFIADTIKIFLLLTIIIFAVSVIRSYLPPNKIRKLLAGRNVIVSSVLAALIGIITPFCSCSAIPLFLGFVEAGVPIGATFSFLIASPMVNEVALILLFGMFGYKVALIYAAFGLIISIIAGLILGKIGAEKWIIKIKTSELTNYTGVMPFKNRLIYAKGYTINIVTKVWVYILIGVGVGAAIHGYVPVNFFSAVASKNHWYAVPAAVLLGIPLYSNAAGIIPLVSVFAEKGVAIGTILAFMMAVTGLSFPEFMILKRILKWQLLTIFIATVAIGIIMAGYLFNAIL